MNTAKKEVFMSYNLKVPETCACFKTAIPFSRQYF